MTLKEKQAIRDWDAYVDTIKRSTPIDATESFEEKERRKKRLEAVPEEWFKYYFPEYAYAEPTTFHKRGTKRILKSDTWYEVRAWSRELAKSTRAMMETLYQSFTGKIRNVMLISHSEDQAETLLAPYKINLESNQRLINDYGAQKQTGSWEAGKFKTTGGVSFQAIGAGQNPRGAKNEWIRPDKIIFDDIDTDEEVRNEDRIQKKWEWIEQAVIPTVSVSMKKQFLFLGNIIGKVTCITKAMEKADHAEIINIRDKDGKSTWPQKNTEKAIDWLLGKMSFASAEKEYFNNPVFTGTVFKKVVWGKAPRIDHFQFLVKYGDPSYSNKTDKNNSRKCTVLMGWKDNRYYLLTARLDKATNATFVGWYPDIERFYSHPKVQQYNYIENNSLQDPFYQQVLLPEFNKQEVPISGDDRNKPDKFFRVEGNLEKKVNNGEIVFNEKEKDNPHMKLMAEQFLAYSKAMAKKLDGPDTVEGAVFIIDQKKITLMPDSIVIGKRKHNPKKRIQI